MTPEELLKPRYKVIATYPNCYWSVGKILTMDKDEHFEISSDEFYDINYIDAFPHLFKRLEWWEDRTIEDFKRIKYVRVTTYRAYWLVGDLVKVTKVILGEGDFYGFDLSGKRHAFCDVEPVSEPQYNNLKQKV